MTETLQWLERARASPAEVRDSLRISTDPEQARMAALALRAAGPGGARALIEALDAADPRVRAVVIEAAALLPEATSALAERVEVEDRSWLRRALVRVVGPRDPHRALAWIDDPDSSVRAEALRAAPRDSAASERAALVLRAVDPTALEVACARFVAMEIAWHACTILAASPIEGAVPELLRLCLATDPFVAAQAAQALFAAGREVERPDLRLGDPAVPTDLAGLRQLRDDVAADLELAEVVLLRTSDPLVLRAALGRLAGSSRTTPALAKALAHPLDEVRKLALTSLDRRQSAQVWSAYLHMEEVEPEPDLREALLWTLGRRSEPESLAPLVAAAHRPSSASREIAVEALLARVKRSGRARIPSTAEALIARLGDGTERERLHAAEALGRFTDPATAEALRLVAERADGPLLLKIQESLARR